MAVERISFPGHDGSQLDARLDRPDGPHLATAIFAHCFTCGKDIAAARRIAARLAAMGIAVLRFDFTGLGHSGGEFANTSFSSNVQDLVQAAEWATDQGMAPTLLVGHSLGGAAVIKAASMLDGIKAVATIGAPFDPGHVQHHFKDAIPEISSAGAAEVNLGGRSFTIGKTFIEDIGNGALGDVLGKLGKPLLVLHAPLDATVSVDSAAQIFMAAKHPKSYVSLDDADHLVSRPEDAEYAADVIATWAGRYLDITQPAADADTPEGIVRVSEANEDGFLQDISSAGHGHLLADEPTKYGGTNLGMSPYGYLSASLGACTSMTIRMYARRKGWPLVHVSVDVSHDKVHAEDSADANYQKIDSFKRLITLRGDDLDAAQRARLLEIADRCPVHRTLERSSKVETLLAQ
ncbi:MAG: bifunctional alpha/beta hydrolase/OsmC family protein [Sulfitobacter sp.]